MQPMKVNEEENGSYNMTSPYNRNSNGHGLNAALESPYNAQIKDERIYTRLEQRKYKEDLDYLINLRRRIGEEEFIKRYGAYFNDLKCRYEAMNQQFNHDQFENKVFKKSLMKEYEHEMLNNKDRERLQKQVDLEKEKKILESVDYQLYCDSQRKIELKQKMRSENLKELDQYYQKKHGEEVKKFEDNVSSRQLMDDNSRKEVARENQYRSKLNNMNEKIYDNALKFSGYFQSTGHNSPKIYEPFYMKNDHEFNRKVAEMKAHEKESLKTSSNDVSERLKDLQKYREFEQGLKTEKIENQKMYKDYLDHQKHFKSDVRGPTDEDANPLIMPAYHYNNRPLPTSKKAIDSINWVKNNHIETLRNGYRNNTYLGDTKLRHNPITQPMNNNDYNRYINKQRQVYERNFNSSEGNILAKVGNSVIA